MNIKLVLLLAIFSLSVSSASAYNLDMYVAIHYLYPDITDNQFTISDNGKGQYISFWVSPYPIPTNQQITNAWNAYLIQKAKDDANITAFNNQKDGIVSQIKSEYSSYITDLDTIQNTANPTNAQLIWAVKREAYIEEMILKALKYMVLNWI